MSKIQWNLPVFAFVFLNQASTGHCKYWTGLYTSEITKARSSCQFSGVTDSWNFLTMPSSMVSLRKFLKVQITLGNIHYAVEEILKNCAFIYVF